MRYIDADKLIDDIRPFAEYDSNRRNKDWVRRFEITINAQPTADAVEAVRCKDCKYATYDKSIDRYDCRNWGLDGEENTEADDFCSYGKKRDD